MTPIPPARRTRVPVAVPGARALWLAVALSAAAAFSAIAAPVKTPHVEAELVAGDTALVPGTAMPVALRLKMEAGWHTYWRNPGDSGLPTTLAWTLPAGVDAGPIEWPAPQLLPVGPLANFGYEGEVLLLTQLKPAAHARAGQPGRLQCPRRLARVQGNLHSRGRRPRADTAGWKHDDARSSLGRAACRGPRRAAAAARGLAGERARAPARRSR